MIKSLELCDPGSCLNKASPDEPVFVLRAKDPRAAQAVRLWVAMSVGRHEDHKISEAQHLADEMDEWRNALTAQQPEPAPSLNRDAIEEAERSRKTREALIGRRF